MKNLNKQKGFTLIELVVVIVILGILAVTAAPKFIDISGDAKGGVVKALKGAMNSAADMVHAKALVQNQTAAIGSVLVNGVATGLVHGWPSTDSIGSLLELGDSIEALVTDPVSTGSFNHKDATAKATCVAVYVNSTDVAVRPSITTVVTGC
jgi:MSHA pilin protein MshA